MLEQNNSSILSKVSPETGLVVIPFFFTLIVFMSQVGKFFFYDIPLQHISISLGELFSFWFGFFIVVGIIGWTLVSIIVEIVQKSEPKGVFRIVLLYPLTYFLIYFLSLKSSCARLMVLYPLENTFSMFEYIYVHRTQGNVIGLVLNNPAHQLLLNLI